MVGTTQVYWLSLASWEVPFDIYNHTCTKFTRYLQWVYLGFRRYFIKWKNMKLGIQEKLPFWRPLTLYRIWMYSSSAPVVSSSRCPDISLAELHRSCRSIWWSLQGDVTVMIRCLKMVFHPTNGRNLSVSRFTIWGNQRHDMGCSGYGACPLFVAIWENTRKWRPVIKLSGCPANKPRWPSLIWQNFNARLVFRHVQSCLSFAFFLQSFSWNRFFASMLEGFRLNLENHQKYIYI